MCSSRVGCAQGRRERHARRGSPVDDHTGRRTAQSIQSKLRSSLRFIGRGPDGAFFVTQRFLPKEREQQSLFSSLQAHRPRSALCRPRGIVIRVWMATALRATRRCPLMTHQRCAARGSTDGLCGRHAHRSSRCWASSWRHVAARGGIKECSAEPARGARHTRGRYAVIPDRTLREKLFGTTVCVFLQFCFVWEP